MSLIAGNCDAVASVRRIANFADAVDVLKEFFRAVVREVVFGHGRFHRCNRLFEWIW